MVQCYQRREYILHVFTFLHVRCSNLHENQPDLECSYFGTSYILELIINGTFHASLPQIFTLNHRSVQIYVRQIFSSTILVKVSRLVQRMVLRESLLTPSENA